MLPKFDVCCIDLKTGIKFCKCDIESNNSI